MSSEARFFANVLTLILTDGALVGACIFAWLKGRSAERYGASIYCLAAVASSAFELWSRQNVPVLPTLIFDMVVAIAFLVLAVRYNSLWLGAAMIIKGVQLALHAVHFTDQAEQYVAGGSLYALSLDAVSIAISATLIGGTFASIRARRLSAPSPS